MIREIDPKFSQFHDAKNKSKAALARAITGLHEVWLSQYPDFQLQSKVSEATTSPLSKETQRLIERLKKDGYVTYETRGASPRILKSVGMPFLYVDPTLEDLSFSSALVAFKPTPESLFLAGSKDLPYEKQQEILEEEKSRVAKKYPGAGLIVREGVEWPEVSWQHFNATNKTIRLFGKDFGYAYTWMPKYESNDGGANRAIAWRGHDQNGFDGYFTPPDNVHPRLGLASLGESPRV